MSCENSYNQDAHAIQKHLQGHEQRDQPIEHEVPSIQQEHSDSASSMHLLHQAEQEQECHTGLTMMFTQEQTLMSAEEFYLRQELRIQKLQQQKREEKLQHLVKVKELTCKLTTLDETPRKPASLCMITLPTPTPLQPPTVVTSASNVIVSDSNSESKTPTTNPSFSLEVELSTLKRKLSSQRIKQLIETEEAIHRLKMQQLSALK